MRWLVFIGFFIMSGLGQAASDDVYNPDNNMLILSQVSVPAVGSFCDVRIYLGTDGRWDLLQANGCRPSTPVDNRYDLAGKVLTVPSMTVHGSGDFCNVTMRLDMNTWRWGLLSSTQCSGPAAPRCQPSPARFNQVTYGQFVGTDDIPYGTGATYDEAVGIIGCQPLSFYEDVPCIYGGDNNRAVGLCSGAVWNDTAGKEVIVIFLSTLGSARKAIIKSGFGYAYYPGEDPVELP